MDLFDSDEPEDLHDVDESVESFPGEPDAPLHPRAAQTLVGHEDIEQQLLGYCAAGRMPHALIFSGPAGIGKATMAYRLARFLLRHGKAAGGDAQDSLFGAPEPALHTSLDVPAGDPVFARVASGGHPDLLSIERPYDEAKGKFKASVPVEDVRKVTPFLRHTAADGGWRVVIVDDADTMTRSSQNAILKILEEPPANSILILVAHRAGAMLPTIRSRSRVIAFQALSPERMKDLLAKYGHRLSGEEFSMLFGLSQGSIGKALQLLAGGSLAMTGQILDLLARPAPDWAAIHKFSDAVANADDGFEVFGDLMQSIYGNLARAKVRNAEPHGFGVHKAWAATVIARTPLQKLLEAGEALEQNLTRVLFANLDRRQGVLAAFSLIS